MSPVTVTPSGTDLVAQRRLDNCWVNLDLSTENWNDAVDKIASGTRDMKESSVERFDLLFGIDQSWP